MIFSVAAQAKTYFVCLKAGPGPILANICWRAAKTASGLKCRFEMRRRHVHWMWWDDTLDMCAI